MTLSNKARRRLMIVIMVAPAFVVLFGVVVYPFFYNVVLSLSNMSLLHIRDSECFTRSCT